MEFAKEYHELIELAFSTNVIHDGYRFNFEDDFSKIESLDDIKVNLSEE